MNGARIVIFDNYDSFTWNLHHYIRSWMQTEVPVILNDAPDWTFAESADLIVLSPGPGLPATSNRLMECIHHFAPQKALLGICLGHQALAEYTGAQLKNLRRVYHGVASPLTDAMPEKKHVFTPFFPMQAGRYHSWAVDENSLDGDWQILQRSHDGEIMAMEHLKFPWLGMQYHPESVMTDQGPDLLKTVVAHLLARKNFENHGA